MSDPTFQASLSANGGRLGYILLRAINRGLGGQLQAIKILVIALLVIVIISMLIYYRIKIPSLRFEAITDHYEAMKSTVKKARESV